MQSSKASSRWGSATGTHRPLCMQASSLAGWDVVSPEECLLSNSTWRLLTAAGPPGKKLGARFVIQTGQVLQQRDKPCRQFFVLLEVRSLCSLDPRPRTLDRALLFTLNPRP